MKSLPSSPLLRRFKTLRRLSASGRRTLPLALFAAVCGAAPVGAATVTLTAGDTINTSSFNTAGHWSNNAAPTAANDYVNASGGTAGFLLRTPAAAGPFTFAGNSLTLGDGSANLGILLYKGTGPATDVITINNLTANLAQISNGNGSSTFTLAGTMTVGTGGVTFITNGDNNGTARTIIVNAAITGPGPVNINSLTAAYGSTIFNGTNSYTGGTTISANGTLRLTQLAALPGYGAGGTPTAVTVGAGGTLALFVGGPNDFAAADIDRVRNNAVFGAGSFLGFDTTNATTGFTYSTNITGNIGFAKTGANTMFLTGTNTYTGGTRIFGGTLNFTNIGNFGSGAINLAGGTLQYATGNTTDITSAATVNLTSASGIDTNGNNVTFAGAISGTTGSLTKYGAGNLTLTSTISGLNFFERSGQVIVSGPGANVTNASFSSIGQLNGDNATLTIQNGAKFSVASDFNISDVATSVGTLLISDDTAAGTTVNVKTLYVGKSGTDSGVVAQTGGTLQAAAGAGDWRVGGATAADTQAVGTYDIGGGSTFSTTTNFQVGAYGIGQMTITGFATVSADGFPVVGRFAGSNGTLNVLGGSFTQTGAGNFLIVGESGVGTLNVSGTGFLSAANGVQLRIGNLTSTASPGVGFVNLGTGGAIVAKAVNTADPAATSVFNFHGGTLIATAPSASFLTGLTGAYVYGEGAMINSNGSDITVNQPLLAPTANGVLSLPVATGGAGYLANPVILISDPVTGGGVGASAIPVLTGGVLTGVTITNPGLGYQSTASINVTITGGNPTTPATLGTPVLGASASGALTKLGTGALTLGGVNTYGGGTVVSAGRLVAGVAGALGTTGNITLATGTTLDVSALGAGGFTLDAGRTLTSNGATVTGLLSVSGTYVSTGASALNGGLTVNSGGVVSATGGTLTLAGAVTNNGTIRLTGGGTLAASGATSFVNNGLIDLLGGTAQFPANFSNGANGVVLTSDQVRVASVAKTATTVTVRIASLTGFTYQLQRSTTLGASANYVNVGAPQTGSTGTTLTLTDSAPTGNQAFYRVVLSR